MKLTPRYDDPSFLRFEAPVGDPGGLMVRQRQRLAGLLSELDEAQWATASRCDEWSVRDVVAHLVSTNQFWTFSIGAARAGEPTRFLRTFDPVRSPIGLVDAVSSQTASEVLEHFVDTNEALATAVEGLESAAWDVIGEAPPGHVPLRAVAIHALWDAWVHERDIVLPLGLAPTEEPDEISACLAYGAALGPAFSITRGSTRAGAILVDAADPQVHAVVEVADSVVVHAGEAPADALHLTGPAVGLLEGLSFRIPLPCAVAPEHEWLLGGLSEAFDRES